MAETITDSGLNETLANVTMATTWTQVTLPSSTRKYAIRKRATDYTLYRAKATVNGDGGAIDGSDVYESAGEDTWGWQDIDAAPGRALPSAGDLVIYLAASTGTPVVEIITSRSPA